VQKLLEGEGDRSQLGGMGITIRGTMESKGTRAQEDQTVYQCHSHDGKPTLSTLEHLVESAVKWMVATTIRW
jgi:hypothetical protein